MIGERDLDVMQQLGRSVSQKARQRVLFANLDDEVPIILEGHGEWGGWQVDHVDIDGSETSLCIMQARDGAVFGPHMHDRNETLHVLSGTLKIVVDYGNGDERPYVVEAGSSFKIRHSTKHWGRSRGFTLIAATYVPPLAVVE